MPELPEVETLKLGLQKYVVGKKITDVEVIDPRFFQETLKRLLERKLRTLKSSKS